MAGKRTTKSVNRTKRDFVSERRALTNELLAEVQRYMDATDNIRQRQNALYEAELQAAPPAPRRK